MSYTPPSWNAADIELFGLTFTPPSWSAADIEFIDVAFSTVSPSGFAAASYGAPTIVPGPATVAPSSIGIGALGSHTIYNSTRFVLPPGLSPGAFGGVSQIYNKARFVSDVGLPTSTLFGSHEVIDPTQRVNLSGMASFGVGVPAIENLNRTVYPQRIDPVGLGTPFIIGPRYVSAKGADSAAVGAPSLIGPRYVVPRYTVDPYRIPRVNVGYAIRIISPAGVAPPLNFSNHVVFDGLNRYVYTSSVDSPELFEPIVARSLYQAAELVGSGDQSAFGSTTVDFGVSDGKLYPRGIGAGAPGVPRVNPVTLSPRDINAGAFGVNWVSNKIRYVSGAGKITGLAMGTQWASLYIRTVEAEGFDRSIVWDEFGPIDDSGYAARVYNAIGSASGIVQAHGFDSALFGSPSLRIDLC